MGQNRHASLGIMDSQSVKWGNNQALSGYDGNKKVKGIKRHVVVDKNGFLIAVMVTAAQLHDSKAVILLMRVLKALFCNLKVIIADGGYRGEIIQQVKKVFSCLMKIVMRSDNQQNAFKPIHKDG